MIESGDNESGDNLYRFDDVTVDGDNFRVQKDGQNVALTPRAFDVLIFLLQNGGRVVEKQELFDRVWKDTFVSDNALTKIVKEIRRALVDDAGTPRYIETVPKRGYRFIAPMKCENASEKSAFIADTKGVSESTANNTPALEKSNESIEKSNQSVSPPEAVSPRARRKFLFIGTAVLITLVAAASFFLFNKSRSESTVAVNAPIDSIAVLPFENAARDANVEYLSDGITESLINDLSRLKNLKVMSRSSVFHYKGKEQNAQKVGGELNVRAVLTGSVKQVGDQIVINVRLDDARDNRNIWGEQYIRKFADILTVQSEITQEVSRKLRMQLTTRDRQLLTKRYTENVEAYQLYLKGVYEWNKFTSEGLQKNYHQAIEKDSNYALAYAGLADSYSVLGNNFLPPRETYPKAKIYALKALAIDETLPMAHVSLGAIEIFYEWDWAEAEKELKRALELDAHQAQAHHLYGYLLEAAGKLDEAKAEMKLAQELDPLSLLINTDLGFAFYYARQYDEAINQSRLVIDLDARFFLAYLALGQSYAQKGMNAEAVASFQKGINAGTRNPSLLASLAFAQASAGQKSEAQKALDELREMSRQHYVSPYWTALIYAGSGDKEQAVAWLEKAYQERAPMLIWLSVEPRFDSLRGDSRYTDLLRRIGLE
jgi:TolB-like protein/DNA-binding winged helix-turn-helix (wHTH) protein/Flp pilus assembly protein TadD